jgi:hypothetical protein
MNQVWIIVAALVALLLFTRIRSRRRGKLQRRKPAPGPRIQGFQVSAFIHPRMGAACLFDHGLVFGKGFRRKEGPQLPHDADCRCEAVAFSFTSTEVFNGALRTVAGPRSAIEGLQTADAAPLIDRLKAVESQPLPPDAAGYAAAVELTSFPPSLHPALQAFLAERYAFLRQAPQQQHPGSADSITADRLEPSKQT